MCRCVWVGVVCAGGATSFSFLRGGDCGCLYRGSWWWQGGVSWVGVGWWGRVDLAGALSFSFHKSLSFGGGDGLMWGAGRLGCRVFV